MCGAFGVFCCWQHVSATDKFKQANHCHTLIAAARQEIPNEQSFFFGSWLNFDEKLAIVPHVVFKNVS